MPTMRHRNPRRRARGGFLAGSASAFGDGAATVFTSTLGSKPRTGNEAAGDAPWCLDREERISGLAALTGIEGMPRILQLRRRAARLASKMRSARDGGRAECEESARREI
jgi:hypothetical protein